MGGAVGDAIVHALEEGSAPPPPPPPKVWCVTLRRVPPLTPEDQPQLGTCEKCFKLVLLFPPAMVFYAFGWAIYMVLQFIACVLAPIFGPAVLSELAERRLALRNAKGNAAAAQQGIADAKKVAGCASCLVNLMWCTWTELIMPLKLLWAW